MTSPNEAGSKARAATLADAIEQARRADPPGTGTKLEITHDDWDTVVVPALRAFAASATAPLPANARAVAEILRHIEGDAQLSKIDVARLSGAVKRIAASLPQAATQRSGTLEHDA